MPSTQSAQKTAAATRMAATSGSRRSAVIATGPTSCARSSVATAMTALVLGDENSPKPQPSTSRQATVKASGAAAESVASRPRPAPSVRPVRFREIGAAGALAALRAGDVDVLRGLPHTALPALRRLGGFRLESRPALVGLRLEVDAADWQVMFAAWEAGRLPFFLAGWRFDEGDALGFLQDCSPRATRPDPASPPSADSSTSC